MVLDPEGLRLFRQFNAKGMKRLADRIRRLFWPASSDIWVRLKGVGCLYSADAGFRISQTAIKGDLDPYRGRFQGAAV